MPTHPMAPRHPSPPKTDPTAPRSPSDAKIRRTRAGRASCRGPTRRTVHRVARQSARAAWLLAAIVLAGVGCTAPDSGSTTTAAAPSADQPHSASVSPPTAPAASSVVPDVPQPCRASDVTATVGQSSSAAGSIGFPIIFTAASERTCELDGFPRVSYVTGRDGEPVGAPAVPEGQRPPGPVRVGVAEPASALVVAVNVRNYDEDLCAPVAVTGLRVYLPGDEVPLHLERPGTACSRPEPVTTQLRVGPVVPGTTGQ
ncbi:MAG: DUF4232 domain-containing protein [Rhodococcus sp. (in: high G+C Gram-positive bacteria)]|nr:MAG: DUF4232 domain-containing protein [Rhodococcus sp. (in: high G+C Gram-positive bacteria)]